MAFGRFGETRDTDLPGQMGGNRSLAPAAAYPGNRGRRTLRHHRVELRHLRHGGRRLESAVRFRGRFTQDRRTSLRNRVTRRQDESANPRIDTAARASRNSSHTSRAANAVRPVLPEPGPDRPNIQQRRPRPGKLHRCTAQWRAPLEHRPDWRRHDQCTHGEHDPCRHRPDRCVPCRCRPVRGHLHRRELPPRHPGRNQPLGRNPPVRRLELRQPLRRHPGRFVPLQGELLQCHHGRGKPQGHPCV